MLRSVLDEAHIHPSIRKTIADSHADIVREVQAAVVANDVVVVGMKQNPQPKKARKALDAAGIPHKYLGYGSYLGPLIVSRNLTPDKTGLPEGGHTLAQFTQILRTGVDMDNLHPTCTNASPTPFPANCIPPPVDGSRLQVMPWPDFQDMTEQDLRAIYEYLSALPAIMPPP